MARGSKKKKKRVVYGWPVVVYGWPLKTQVQVVQKTIEIQRFAVRGEHRWIFDIQTSESLVTASVRWVTPAEIVEVIEIAARVTLVCHGVSSGRTRSFKSLVRLCFSLGTQEQARRHRWNAARLEGSCCCGVTEVSGGGQGCLKLENTGPSVIVMGFHSSATVDVEHDALWEIPIVQGGQTTENLDTALVRHVAQTVIVVVVEIGALLPTDSAILMFVAAPVLCLLQLL